MAGQQSGELVARLICMCAGFGEHTPYTLPDGNVLAVKYEVLNARYQLRSGWSDGSEALRCAAAGPHYKTKRRLLLSHSRNKVRAERFKQAH